MLFFLRDGEIYQADVTALIQDACPRQSIWSADSGMRKGETSASPLRSLSPA